MKLVLLALLCQAGSDCTPATASDVISRPATPIECAMPAMALMPMVAERPPPAPGEAWMFRCVREHG